MLMSPLSAVAQLNDAFRRAPLFTGPRPPGRVLITRGIALLPVEQQLAIVTGVQQFDAFTPSNDPHKEHDFGKFAHDGLDVIWKVDYYADASCTYGSDNPADPTASYRVLTIMRAEEY